MSKPTSNASDEADFVLKHRITGAAFLLFFGALFLPWLLGPPSEALKAEEPISLASQTELNSSEIEDELLTALESQTEETPEQVYISKITPFDEQSTGVAESVASENSDNGESEQPSSESPGDSNAIAEGGGVEPKKNAQVVPEQVAKSSPVAEPAVVKPEKVDVGWVVQVGVFEKAEGAAKELAELRAQGFSPSTSEMDTNQKSGKATRVWLGPFSRRVDAAKSRAQLTEKTGKAGYIRAYP